VILFKKIKYRKKFNWLHWIKSVTSQNFLFFFSVFS
jgi:hypothetical protein